MGVEQAVVRLEETDHGVVILRRPVQAPTAGVVIVHAPGENRTGNNYFLSHAAAQMAAQNMATVNFHLSGFGDSLGRKDVATWAAQVESAGAWLAAETAGQPVHFIARGAGAAVLPADAARGQRIAIGPPTPAEVKALAATSHNGSVTGAHPCPPDEEALWAALGAEPNLVGGLELPEEVLIGLASRLDTPRWDHEVVPRGREARVRSRILLPADDLLVRMQITRLGLTHTLIEFLRSWS
ncbi:hypothetical protein [Streptomyces rubiginosohelvolus]|uniref:hypothetical protein n=1 Tax=Streptomyces rubiginosohelvolus TaxID=67362 RepID=UPI0036B47CD1